MLLSYQDLQPALNIDLTDPNGQALADSLIAATQALLSSPLYLGFPMEAGQATEYRSNGQSLVWLSTTAPVSAVSAALFNTSSNTYDTVDAGYVINHGGREVLINRSVPEGFHSLRLVYTTGWTAETIPADLKQAIIDIVGLKLLEVANYSSAAPGTSSNEEEETETSSTSGPLKKVVSLGYTEEFSTAETDAYWKAKTAQMTRTVGDDIPQSVKDLVLAYQPPFAI
jgi:hypothetical protein